MADLKRRTLQLSSGKQVKLFGNSVAISKSLEIGEGGPPNILSIIEEQSDGKYLPGYRIRTVTGAIQAGDQWSNVQYQVEEWLQP